MGYQHRRAEDPCYPVPTLPQEVRVSADGDVTLKMTVLEARTLRRLLELAGDEFGRHGDNDFSVEREENGRPLAGLALLRAMVESGAAEEEQLEGTRGTFLIECQLFRHFERRVEKALRTQVTADEDGV